MVDTVTELWLDNDMTTAQINGTTYHIHTNDRREVNGTALYRITGTRKADGALIIRNGKALVVGISNLERLNWWDINRAIAGLVAEVAA